MRQGVIRNGLLSAVVAVALAGCAPMSRQASNQAASATPPMPACVAAASGDPLVGNWLAVGTQKGVAGALRTLYTLNADGTMAYVEQIKRPRTPSQGLYESGCWSRNGNTLVLRTLLSNGSPVNLDDPIYTNRYRVGRVDAAQLLLQGPNGSVNAKRMSAGYRLPF